MKTLFLLLLIPAISNAEENCRKRLITKSIKAQLTLMADDRSTDCAEYAQGWQELADSLPEKVSCNHPDVESVEEMSECYHPKAMIEQIMKDVDEVPYLRICKIYLPQVTELGWSRCGMDKKKR